MENPWHAPALPKDDITQRKMKFAAELCRSLSDPYKAALRAFGDTPDNRAYCLQISMEWADDPDVRAEVKRLYEERGEEDFSVPRELFAQEVYEFAKKDYLEPEDRIKALKLYAEIRGFVQKPGTVINNSVDNRRAVLVVPRSESEDEWEQRLMAQQARLVANA